MISKNNATRSSPRQAYVWMWLPDATDPVVVGRLVREHDRLIFGYSRSYLERNDRISIFEPELPLQTGQINPHEGLHMAGCLRDASPDAWGRRVIIKRSFSRVGSDIDATELDDLTYILESNSDRIGALDFQDSASEYIPRESQPTALEALLPAIETVENALPLTEEVNQALNHATSIGGARPKAMIQTTNKKMIAKFASSTDRFDMVKSEFLAMRLAKSVGLNVASVRLAHSNGKGVLLVDRFDRTLSGQVWVRKAVVSALTIFGLDEMTARYASYEALAQVIRYRFTSPKSALHELFGRLVFNIICGNTDDHARNHAAFWDGKYLSLTPAYDICPQIRHSGVANQGMLIVGTDRSSTLETCLRAAPIFQLSESTAKDIIDHQISTVRGEWEAMCADAELDDDNAAFLRQHVILNDSIFEGYPHALP